MVPLVLHLLLVPVPSSTRGDQVQPGEGHFFSSPSEAFVPTALPAKPKENARVIVAPCSPLMAEQQRWSWPSTNGSTSVAGFSGASLLTLRSAPQMSVHLQDVPQHAHVVAVLRTVVNASSVARWQYVANTSSLQLVDAMQSTPRCLRYMQNGQFSNVAVGSCPLSSWDRSVGDLPPGAGLASLVLNDTDETIRFIYRDAFNINHRNFSTCLTATWGEPCEPAEFKNLPFCDITKSVDERVDDLLSRASLEEKVAMLSDDDANRPWLARLSVNPNNTQQEALHGAGASGGAPANGHFTDGTGTGYGTSFPHALALAATLNRTLWRLVGRTIALESRAFSNQGVGGLYLRTPNLNIARDARWGRLQETAGEDPTVVSEYGVAIAEGIAGNETTMIAAPAPKHFSCYCGPENWGGIMRWTFDAVVPEKYLTSYFFPGWRATIRTGKSGGSMASSFPIGISPTHAPAVEQTFERSNIARFVACRISGEIRGLDVEGNHGTSTHPYQKQVNGSMSCQAALRGGCDVDCGSTFGAHMLGALAVGNVLPADVALAARHLLKPTVELGLLDGPRQPWANLGPSDIDTSHSRQLALEAAQQAITLLKNERPKASPGTAEIVAAAAPLLPIDQSSTVALIGPALNFTNEMLSNYAGWNTAVWSQSPWARLSARLGSQVISSALGCERRFVGGGGVDSCDVMDNGTAGIPEAVTAAQKADTVIMFVGTNPLGNVVSCPPGVSTCRVTTEAEAVDRTSLELPGAQLSLIQAVAATNPNVVLVMLNAGPLAIEWAAEHVPSIVEAYFPGQMGGDAITSILMGDVAPQGRLPVSWYPKDYIKRNMTDYDLASGNGTTHLYWTGQPLLYEFGFGKSYTAFEFGLRDDATNEPSDNAYRNFSVSGLVDESEQIAYDVRVVNVGHATGAVSVLAFLASDHVDAVTASKLVDFAMSRVLRPGEFEIVRLVVPTERLALIDGAGDEYIAPGEYRLQFGGPGSGPQRDADFVETSFRVTGKHPVFMWQLTKARQRWERRLSSDW